MTNVKPDQAALTKRPLVKKAVSVEAFVFLLLFFGFWAVLGHKMGTVNLMSTLMNTAYDLLISTVFYIMAISVVAGAVAELFNEFGVTSLLNRILSPLIKPVYDLPGASVVGIFACFFSDNPAILTLADNNAFKRYFKKYQVPPLTNIGTSFGMGLVIIAFMVGVKSPVGESFVSAAVIGFVGAVIGSIVSTRLMSHYTKKKFGTEEPAVSGECTDGYDMVRERLVREGSIGGRILSSLLEGGKSGVKIGLDIIPGVLIICSVVMLLTFSEPAGGYTGGAYEGVAFLPWVGEKLSFILTPLFGFSSPESISVPIMSLGAAGAAISVVPRLVSEGLAHANDIAVFTAICMCWSGYLSTHIAMLEELGYRELSGRSILYHTIGGLVAGISANWIFKLIMLI